MKQQLLALRESQKVSYIRKEGLVVISNENLLPDLVDPNKDWSLSATKQWSKNEIEWIAKTPGSKLATAFAPIADPWLHMGALAELILHDDVDRARAFTQGLIQQSPDAQNWSYSIFWSCTRGRTSQRKYSSIVSARIIPQKTSPG